MKPVYSTWIEYGIDGRLNAVGFTEPAIAADGDAIFAKVYYCKSDTDAEFLTAMLNDAVEVGKESIQESLENALADIKDLLDENAGLHEELGEISAFVDLNIDAIGGK